jgi:DNA-binding MarR family transcriptional regulator
MSDILNEQGRAALNSLAPAIQPFRDISKTSIPASGIAAFCLIAMREGRSMSDCARVSGVGQMAMSRTVQDMLAVNRYGGIGLGLVEQRSGLHNGRSVTVHLTAKGRLCSQGCSVNAAEGGSMIVTSKRGIEFKRDAATSSQIRYRPAPRIRVGRPERRWGWINPALSERVTN